MTTVERSFSSRREVASAPPTASMFFSLLERMEYGRLALTTPDGITRHFGGGAGMGIDNYPAEAEMNVRDWRVFRDVITGGDVAFADSYMAGRWDTRDLTALLTVVGNNQRALELAFYGRWWRQLAFRLRHLLRSNSRRRARRNIIAHYDLGNDFYRLWLDPTMTYSAAMFDGDTARTLTDAQRAKYARVLQQLAPATDAHLLEIGGGWGGFAETAASAGCRITSISLSDAQTAHARERIARGGLGERVDFRIEDYRDVRGQYDGVASIEMFEAVGERYWPAFFSTLRRVLKPGARACLQTITIADDRFERYRQTSDFIQQYIFPGGMLASPSRFAAEVHAAGLAIQNVYRFGHDYAETLKRWLAGFDARIDQVRAQGFDQRFIRCWRFYLAYCAAGFASETTDVAQYTLVRA